jgi:hypothetical protein
MVAPVEAVTLCHKSLGVVGVCLGGLDFSSNGQKANQGSKATPVQRKEAATADARDVKTNVSLQLKIN